MEQAIKEFFIVETLEDAINQLKFELEFDSQNNYFDFIFSKFIHSFEQNITTLEDIIPGLSRSIKICIFTAYYRHLVYGSIPNSEKNQNQLFSLFQNHKIKNDSISMSEYCDYLLKIVSFFEEKPQRNLPGKIEYVKSIDKYFIPYFLIGKKASLITLHNFCDGIFDESKILRIYVSMPFVDLKSGPHFGAYNDFIYFFFHDFGHYLTTTEAILKYEQNYFKYQDFYQMCKKDIVLSFRHRYSSFILFSFIHEGWYKPKIEDDIFTIINNFETQFMSHDTTDTIYCLSYITKAYDFSVVNKDKINQIKSNLNAVRTGCYMKDCGTFYDEIKQVLHILSYEFLNGTTY